jgi:hypothetical protein
VGIAFVRVKKVDILIAHDREEGLPGPHVERGRAIKAQKPDTASLQFRNGCSIRLVRRDLRHTAADAKGCLDSL